MLQPAYDWFICCSFSNQLYVNLHELHKLYIYIYIYIYIYQNALAFIGLESIISDTRCNATSHALLFNCMPFLFGGELTETLLLKLDISRWFEWFCLNARLFLLIRALELFASKLALFVSFRLKMQHISIPQTPHYLGPDPALGTSPLGTIKLA